MSSEINLSTLKTEPPESDKPDDDANDASSSLGGLGGLKKDIPGTPTPERPPSSPTSSSSGPGDSCSICLGAITDKCVTDSCLHSFCLLCLKEWSKQKAVCPLCKLSFTKIMYDIKSESQYKEWKVPEPEPRERNNGFGSFQEFLNVETRRFFGYGSTLFPGAPRLRRLYARSLQVPDAIPPAPPQRRSRYSNRGSSMFRLSVYLNDIWVQPLADVTGRFRQSSPQLYREQPGLTHRLVPWVNRELSALLPPSRIGNVLSEVLDLIERHPINSREFRLAMQPHLERRASHFSHEFYHFARSPYDMVGHDNAALYFPRYHNGESSSNSSDSDSDAVVEIDSTGNPIASTSSTDATRGQAAPGNVAREETLTHEGSVVISSSSSSSSSGGGDSSDDDNDTRSRAISADDFALVTNPEPPPSLLRNKPRKSRAKAHQNVNEGASTSKVAKRASGSNADPAPGETSSDTEDSEGCYIINQVVPEDPIPELIEIDSDDEGEHSNRHSTALKDEVDLGEEHSKAKKLPGKSKPTLKRNNFTGSDTLCNDKFSCDSHVAQQDHSYCTEEGSSCAAPSTSNASAEISQECQGSSQKMDEHGSSSQEHSQKEASSRENSQNELCESDFSMSEEDEKTARAERLLPSNERQEFHFVVRTDKYTPAENEKRKRRREHLKASSPLSKKLKPSRNFTSSVSLPKKDLKSKIKSSAYNSSSRTHSSAAAEAWHKPNKRSRSARESSSDSLASPFDAKHKRHKKKKKNRQKETKSLCESPAESRLPSSSGRDKYLGSYHQRRSQDSCSEDSDAEARIERHKSSAYYKSHSKRKSLKKHHKRSKDKHHERTRSNSKKSKHKKRSKDRPKDRRYREGKQSDSEYSEHKKHRKTHKRSHSSPVFSNSDSTAS